MLRRTGFKRREYQRAPPSKPAMCRPGVRLFTLTDQHTAVPKDPPPLRSEPYRRLVASLECFHCGVHLHSQAAHPNTGKAKGRKHCDSLIFPLCTVGANDCHGRFDSYRLVSRADMPAFEARALAWTVQTLLARGLWPRDMPIPPQQLNKATQHD